MNSSMGKFGIIAAMVLSGLLFASGPKTQAKTEPLPAPVPCQNGACWQPKLNTRWNYVLSEAPKLSIKADVYDIDLFDTTATQVHSIHTLKRKAICYFSAGSSENWRPDFASFPKAVLGSNLEGWPGERWLDIRNIAALAPIMQARLNLCKQKGFDGVEFDNVDAYVNKNGFPLTAADQLRYNMFLANQAHKLGLSVGLKNDLEQVPALVPYFDYAVNEQCFQYKECSALTPFIQAGKPVFNVEYNGSNASIFKQANQLNFNTIKKSTNLANSVTFSR